MRLRRETAHHLHTILDQWLPPAVRDARWFMKPLFKIFYGRFADDFLDFKERAHTMSAQDFTNFYAKIADAPPHRDTHLTQACLNAILREASPANSVLDVGAGKGFLAKKLASALPQARIVACDIHMEPLGPDGAAIQTIQSSIEHLPFADKSFDAVTCTHTLEHVMDLSAALAELRRVTAHTLIIVVPRQRPYRYTFDPHVWFFPYRINITTAFGTPMGIVTCEDIGGDWIYTETRA